MSKYPSRPLIILPAYGRDYKDEASVEQDWSAGKDFVVCDISCRYDRRYLSVKDVAAIKTDGYDGVKIRFNNKTDILMLNI